MLDKVDIEHFVRVFEMLAVTDSQYAKRLRTVKLMDKSNKLTERGRRMVAYLIKDMEAGERAILHQ
jgi:hypothetical protein